MGKPQQKLIIIYRLGSLIIFHIMKQCFTFISLIHHTYTQLQYKLQLIDIYQLNSHLYTDIYRKDRI